MKQKKGQAALEFLSTYGWAFLIIIVVFGALAYMGVLSPSNYIKSSCSLDKNVECPVFALHVNESDTSEVYLDLLIQNNNMNKITIEDIAFSEFEADTYCNSSGPLENNDFTSDIPLSSTTVTSTGPNKEKVMRFKITCSGDNFESAGLTNLLKKKGRYDLSVYYTQGDSTLPSVSKGKLITKAQPIE